MSKSVTKSRLYQRKRVRRRRRRRKITRSIVTVLLIIITTCAIFAAVKGGSEISKKMKYPVEYSSYIVKYAHENDLDPYLVIAVIKQESHFVADARSAYAGGLMQLTEVTANECAGKLGLTNYDYMDPETNIKLGCYLLRVLINRYGSTDTALAAYNAGIGNVDGWLADSNYSRDGKTLYEIPFTETKYYVEKVNQYIKEYKENVEL